MEKIKNTLPDMAYVRHPYWGKTSYTYDEMLHKGFGCVDGQTFSFEASEEDATDVCIQCLDTLEKEARMRCFKLLLQSILSEYTNKVYQNDVKDCETLLAKAQLAHKIIELLDLDIK